MKLSIITINYNDRVGLEKTLRSVEEQTFTDYEFIVVDGGSSDGSAELIKAHAGKITWWVSEKDKGIYNAQNKGLAQAKGEYCLFLNSGDVLDAARVLEKVFAKSISADIAYGNMRIDHGAGLIENGFMPDRITFKQMMVDTLWHPVSFIKRSLFLQHGSYNEQFRLAADYDFFFKTILIKGASTQHVNEFISRFNMEGASSDPGNREKLLQERRNIQLQYYHPSVIEFFDQSQKISAAFPKTFLQKIKLLLKPSV